MGAPAGPEAERDDDLVAATVECPECGERVLVEVDPEDVVCWEEDEAVVNELAPASGFCCGYAFVLNLEGGVDELRLHG
jgi:DNA-directed RNA polymerase subunit RPC12/RpoP